MLVRPSTLSLAPIGPELTSRFFGVSNLLETLAPLSRAPRRARSSRAASARSRSSRSAALALATIAENQLGSDGGGAIVVGVAFALLAVQLVGARRRYTLPALGIAALVVLGLVNLDAAASGPDHLRGALHGGFNGFMNVAANRVPLAYARMVEQWWLLIPGARRRDRRHRRRALRTLAHRPRRRGRDARRARGLARSSTTRPGPSMIGGLAAVLAIEGGLVHRTLALPVLRRLAPPRRGCASAGTVSLRQPLVREAVLSAAAAALGRGRARVARAARHRLRRARVPAHALPRARLHALEQLLVRGALQLRHVQPPLLPARGAARDPPARGRDGRARARSRSPSCSGASGERRHAGRAAPSRSSGPASCSRRRSRSRSGWRSRCSRSGRCRPGSAGASRRSRR